MVIDAAARAQGVPVTKKLQNEVVIGKAKASKAERAAAKGGRGEDEVFRQHFRTIAVLQPTKARAVGMTNAFVKSLGAYAQLQISSSTKSAEYENQVYISNLQDALAALTPAKPTTPTTHQAGHDSADGQAAQGQANRHSACPDDDEHDRKIRPGRTGPYLPAHSVPSRQPSCDAQRPHPVDSWLRGHPLVRPGSRPELPERLCLPV